MNARIPLFGKIFIGFWLATVAVLASWMLASHYFETNPERDALESRPKGPPHRFVLRMIYDLQNLDENELAPLLAQASAEHQVDIYLLDRANEDLLHREVPPEIQRVAGELKGSRRRAVRITDSGHLLAHKLYRPERGVMRAVFAFRPNRHNLLGLLSSNLWLRIGLAVLVSGLVCYALSRLMTSRLGELQLASRQLATGNLDTRLQVRERGGDETDELARDFNSMAEQLQARTQAQTRLLGDVSHELRSPLARLRIALALAQENPPEASRYLQRIEQETERLEALIGQLLASQATELELNSHLDLVPLLTQLIGDANFEGAKLGKQVMLHNTVEQAVVASSGDLLHKSFENILRNALSHTAQGTTVRVSIERQDDRFLVRIEDQGGGVPEQELDKIFGEFYRTDTARTRATGGYGLGLAIARRAVLQHGGQIRAENSGTGLAVTVTLTAH